MRFDDILKAVGEFGPYQRWIFILICLPIIFIGISDVNNALLLYSPKHRCTTHIVYNTTRSYTEDSTQPSGNLTEGFTLNTDNDACFRQVINSSDQKSLKQPCRTWTYDQSVFIETFVTEHNLVCDDANIKTYIQILMYSGALIGSLTQGYFADRLGRQRMMCCSLAIVFASGLASAWSPNYFVFALLRFIQILASRGVYISSFILAIEIVGPSKRQWSGFLFNYSYSAGIGILAGIGYGLRHWKYIQIACTGPMVLFVVYWWIIPESPRWLISQGKKDQARKTVVKMAQSNKCLNCVPPVADFYEKTEKHDRKKHSILHYFKQRSLLFQSLVIFFNSFLVFHCFFGFTLNTGNLAGNFYLNILLSGLADFPGFTIPLLTVSRLGRKKLYILGMVVGGLSLLGSGTVFVIVTGDLKIASIILAMIGKTGMAVGFCVIYIWSAELFPTVVRSSGMGIITSMGNLGYMTVPAVTRLAALVPGRVGRAIPLFVLGSLCLIAALTTLILPETQKVYLPETLGHAKALKRGNQINKEKLHDKRITLT
ncbi:organic cation transporter protein-like [Argopecten irradians]|uniref:organic cation transporter protein-like n=1 Tax=Argopecten irradians TaxID=31199 RepID=UPI00371A2B07